jgi:dimethylargininase
MKYNLAITRSPSATMANCELTHLDRVQIDMGLLSRQHARYVEILEELELEVLELPAEPTLPDAVFVEDAAVVLDELAVITRPGAESRRAETASIARALSTHRRVLHIEAPGTLDGGDVLVLGRQLYVGRSTRSNQEGIEQLARILSPFNYSVAGVEVRGCLHLKSAACAIGDDALLIQEDWLDPKQFQGARLLHTHPGEDGAANVVRLDRDVIFPLAFPRTAERLEGYGLRVHQLDYSELAKAEGGVTCCSLLLRGSTIG